MTLFRLFALAALAWIVWFLWRNHQAKSRRQTGQHEGTSRKQARLGERMVKCRSCDVHLPETDALREGEDWFCSKAHRQAWLQRS